MPQLDFTSWPPQLIWLAISFIALYILMARLALPRIATVIEQRRDRIASDLDEAARLKTETEAALAAYEAELAEARSRAHGIAADTREVLKENLEAEKSKVDQQIAAKTAEAEARIAQVKAKATGAIDEAATETAAEIVRILIGGKPAKKEIADAVKAALESGGA